ncbi:hypothetical protein [Paenibacillus mucilaginosus]|uniref:hypothetical protein n=1 Tax=Paenibacillus mucilaginosus TaxID=61624 RepID=UPI001EE68788|nr:hypothetical protein [Paenibacillus mucilaginosus]
MKQAWNANVAGVVRIDQSNEFHPALGVVFEMLSHKQHLDVAGISLYAIVESPIVKVKKNLLDLIPAHSQTKRAVWF